MQDLLSRLEPKQRKGSKPRCHWFTHETQEQVARRLTNLISPLGKVSADDRWMPEGFHQVEEAQLHKATQLLPQEDRERLCKWWFAHPSEDSKSPNFDIASTFTIDETKGILLVEAKAHFAELKVRDEAGGSCQNRNRIGECIDETNVKMAAKTKPGWALSHKRRYQIANRFAWSSKLTELGYHVILVYLGFLDAGEMPNPFASHSEWESCVESYSKPVLPTEVWNQQWTVNDHIFVPRIMSCAIQYDSPIEDD